MIETFDTINTDGWLTDLLHGSNGIVDSLSGGNITRRMFLVLISKFLYAFSLNYEVESLQFFVCKLTNLVYK